MDEPLINKAYLQLAHHYNFIVSPCRPYTPWHKGGVENDVKYVKRNFLPYFLEKEKQKGIAVPDVSKLKDSLEDWNTTVSEKRTIGGVGKTVPELFLEEKPLLKAMTEKRWDFIKWTQSKVGPEWRIKCNKVWYSVPYTFIGKIVDICLGQQFVRIFHEGTEVALHQRSDTPFEYVRISSHAPLHHEEVLNCTRSGLLQKAEYLGVRRFVEKMFEITCVDKLQPARLLLNLEKKYGGDRLQKACARALHYELYSYRSVKSILKQGLDSEVIEGLSFKPIKQEFKFSRNINYFHEGVING